MPEDVNAQLYNFKMCVGHFAWGYCSFLMDSLLILTPFNSLCDLGKESVGYMWKYKTDQLLKGSLLPSSPNKPVNFKKVHPSPFPNLADKKKKSRRISIHIAKLKQRYSNLFQIC